MRGFITIPHWLLTCGDAVEAKLVSVSLFTFTFIDWVSELNFENYSDFFIPPLPVMQPGKVI